MYGIETVKYLEKTTCPHLYQGIANFGSKTENFIDKTRQNQLECLWEMTCIFMTILQDYNHSTNWSYGKMSIFGSFWTYLHAYRQHQQYLST